MLSDSMVASSWTETFMTSWHTDEKNLGNEIAWSELMKLTTAKHQNWNDVGKDATCGTGRTAHAPPKLRGRSSE